MIQSMKQIRTAALALSGLLLVLGGVSLAFAVGYQLRGGEVGSLERQLETALAGARDANRELGSSQGVPAQLRGQLAELQAAVDERTRELGAVDAELSALREVTIASGMTSAAVEQLRRDYEQLLAEHDALLTRWSQVIPIDSPELSGAPLLLDRGVDNVVVVRPVCTGSMEPNITCDDLLVLYAPSTLSDVDIVDIIYFPKPDADCSGSVPGIFVLHRIVDVVSRSGDILFQTQGDAMARPDRCLVPRADVIYKLLTNIRGSRIAD